MDLLILLILGVSGVCCDSHSQRYYDTDVSAPGSGLPVYSSVGYVDDQEIESYNSDTGQTVPKTEWMKKVEPEYWELRTNLNEIMVLRVRSDFTELIKSFNHTEGIHILQLMYGCERKEDDSTTGYLKFGYDGIDVMYVDTQSWQYIPVVQEANATAVRLNSPKVRYGETVKNYLGTCNEWLKKNINIGREDLERKVWPEVKVWGRQHPDEVTRLQCLAYGFYPRAVDVKWVRNEEDQIPSDEASPILPHPDGTYQIRVSVEVPTRKGDTYSCHVEHSSLEDTLKVKWDPDDGPSVPVIAIAAGIGCLIAAAAVIGGVYLYRKKSHSRRTLCFPNCSFTASPQQCEG